MENKKQTIIKTNGIYYLYKNNKIIYVGQSKFCEKRVYAHIGRIPFNEFLIKKIKKSISLDEVESEKIIKYLPKYNRNIPLTQNKFITLNKFFKIKFRKKLYSIEQKEIELKKESIISVKIGRYNYYKAKELENYYKTNTIK